MIISSSGFVYSSRSNANRKQFEKASKEEQENLSKTYEKDPYELSNHCARFNKQIMLDFFKAKNKAWQLGHSALDSKFEQLKKLLQKYPGNVTASLQLNDIKQTWDSKGEYRAQLSMFINTQAPDEFEALTTEIKPLLRKALLYKPLKNKPSILERITTRFCKTWNKLYSWFKCSCHS